MLCTINYDVVWLMATYIIMGFAYRQMFGFVYSHIICHKSDASICS